MTRRARIILPGTPHHVTQRGNRRQQVFFGRDDYLTYLKLLNSAAEAFEFSVWSYCLMPNHVHILAVPSTESSLRDGLGHVHQFYSRMINRSRGWTGHLWQGRFYSCPVEDEKAAIVARYIELNPVRARICYDPKDYPWSSAKIACEDSKNGKSGFSPIYAPGGTWEEFLKYDPVHDSEKSRNSIRLCATKGVPFGSDAYLRKLENERGLSLLRTTQNDSLTY
jgi:putative transposase